MFYVEKDEKIVLFNEDRRKVENTLLFTPQYAGCEIKETNRPIVNFEWADTQEWEDKQAQKERERINNLTCTKRVFALILQDYGISYSRLKELIASNERAQLEWDLCERLERSNPLLDTMANELGITPLQIDEIFIKANVNS